MKTKLLVSTVLLTLVVYAAPSSSLAAVGNGRGYQNKGLMQVLRQKARGVFSRAVIGSGKLTAINGATLTVVSGKAKTYTVTTDDKTQFRRRFGGKSSLAELQVSDSLNVIGRFSDEAKTTIAATLIRDLSIQKRNVAFVGKVLSLASDGFAMSTVAAARVDQKVSFSAGTKFVDRRERLITQSDIKVGDRVRVKGVWDGANNTITEVTQVKDFSLPAQTVKLRKNGTETR